MPRPPRYAFRKASRSAFNGQTPAERAAVRQEWAKPLINDLEVWMRQQRDRLSPSHDLAKAINYILSRWVAFTRFLDDGRICLSNTISPHKRAPSKVEAHREARR